jgi:hypothetical protein
MSIEEHRANVVHYHFTGKGHLEEWPVITAEPGKVRTNIYNLETVAQVEEYIEALRRAAKVANLPDRSDEAKSA